MAIDPQKLEQLMGRMVGDGGAAAGMLAEGAGVPVVGGAAAAGAVLRRLRYARGGPGRGARPRRPPRWG